MRVLAIGDIHGCARALDLLLEAIQPQPDDLLVTLGDYVDRGPDSKAVLERLTEVGSRCRLVALKGNHDIMMLQARADQEAFLDWYACGGRQTLQSYGTDLEWSTFERAVSARHWQFLADVCVPYFETETHFFVHANAYADLTLVEQPDQMLYWERLDDRGTRAHESGKIMICGHTSQRSGKPLNLGHAVCLDTWVYGDGWLTCLDVRSGQYWQTNQKGTRELHTDWLEDDVVGY
jgi:serine/threonine protein phosphatase 1